MQVSQRKKRPAKRLRAFGGLGLAMALLSGCALLGGHAEPSAQQAQTRLSRPIELTPQAENRRTLLVQFRNTTEAPAFGLSEEVRRALEAKGYTLVNDPQKAQYMLRGYILALGEMAESAAREALEAGFGARGPALTGRVAEAQGGGGLGGLGAVEQGSERMSAGVIDLAISERPPADGGGSQSFSEQRSRMVTLLEGGNAARLRKALARAVTGLF